MTWAEEGSTAMATTGGNTRFTTTTESMTPRWSWRVLPKDEMMITELVLLEEYEEP
jgi:hypothetical protein